MEILHYVPPPLLKGIDLELLSVKEFIHYIAMARYVAELEEVVLESAIRKAFRPD